MIITLLTFFQTAVPAAALTVRAGDRSVSVPVVVTRSGPIVRSDQVLPPLGARLTRVSRDRYTIEAGGARFDLTLDLPAVRVGTELVPVGAAPLIVDGTLYFALRVVTDVIPRFAAGYRYDAGRRELARLASSTGRVPPAVPSATSAVAAPVAPAPSAEKGRPPADATPPNRGAPPPPSRPRDLVPVIVVDAGHGGPDRGMSGPIGASHKVYEADITLAVARRVRDLLQARGAKVIMTRTTDTLIALADRGRIANRAAADVFVSIHVNAANLHWQNPRAARGFETYFLSEAKTEDEKRVQEMENEASKYDVGVDAEPGDPLSYLLADMEQNENLRESSRLAATIQEGLGQVHPSGQDRGVKQAGFLVLVTAHMPAVLVEIGFGTNATEASYLSSASGQQTLARAIADATERYVSHYQQRRESAGSGEP